VDVQKEVCGEGMEAYGAFSALGSGQTQMHGDRHISLRKGSVRCRDPFHEIIS